MCGAGVTPQIKPASEWLTTELRNSVPKRATHGVNRGRGAAENTGMSRIWLGIGVLALSGVVAAQVSQEQPSLGAVAKATKEQRAKAAAAKGGARHRGAP